MKALKDKIKDTQETYGFLWTKGSDIRPFERWHFDLIQDVVPEPIVRGRLGVEIGCGCGYDSYIMARNNPGLGLVSVDISDGVYGAKRLTAGLGNVQVLKGSVLNMPTKNAVFDFAYSYGVLHHTGDMQGSLSEICRVLKRGSPIFTYLYEDHSGNLVKYFSIKVLTVIRVVTTRIPHRILFALCGGLSPFVYCIFTLPAKTLSRFAATRNIAAKIPFNFGKGIFSFKGDLFDRFSAPIEQRFDRRHILNLFKKNGFSNIKISRMKDISGWVAWGYKE